MDVERSPSLPRALRISFHLSAVAVVGMRIDLCAWKWALFRLEMN